MFPQNKRYLSNLTAVCFLLSLAATAFPNDEYDVLIFGATPGGIAAALASGKAERSVLLVEPTHRIGGMTASGLSHPDFRTFEALTGTYLELVKRTLAYYEAKYGPDSQQVKDTFRGTHAEPKVNLQLFKTMIAEVPSITVKTQWELVDAYNRGTAEDRWIRSARFRDADGNLIDCQAKIFIDGSYEGDLIAAAQAPYRIGEESREEYGESGAPEEGSGNLQGYNFRLTMTRDPSIRVPIMRPEGYDRELFTGIIPFLESGDIERVFGSYGDQKAVIKAQIPVLPNNKFDVNDTSGNVRMSLPGEQLMWPEGNREIRREIYQDHLLWNVGILYFLQHDSAVPETFRKEVAEWGFCRDEFVETNHLPPQLYVREARRLMGLRVFTQHDTQHAPGDARAVLHRDSIAVGDYGHSSHGTWHEGSRFGGTRHGQLSSAGIKYAPYQIPYGTIVPHDIRNLLAPVPVSASHVGFCALRLEPIWTSLGQAAGHSAHLALKRIGPPDVRTVSVSELQDRLHQDGSATIHITDVPPGDPDFIATQWWGSAGGFHGLLPEPERLRGKTIEGQHQEAWLNHSVNLDDVLIKPLQSRWTEIALDLALAAEQLPQANGTTTRGDWIRAAFKLRNRK